VAAARTLAVAERPPGGGGHVRPAAGARYSSTMPSSHSTLQLEKLLEARTRELAQLAELSTYLQNFAETERAQLAHNLHDELGGLLTAAKMDLSWLQSRLGEPLIEKRLAQLGDALDAAMNVKRRIVEDLRPSLLDHFGLATALRTHAESRCAKADLKFEAAVDDDVTAVPNNIAIALFRLVQEGLTNITRHADAQRVHLEFRATASSYVLKLSDDGRGFDLARGGHRGSHGLIGMRHRVAALDGQFALRSNPGGGTQIEVEIPKPAP
jgi:protein-histidine pros-kinase